METLLAAIDAEPYSPSIYFSALGQLRADRRLDEIDQLIPLVPDVVSSDAGVMSIWVSVPKIRGDWPEACRRAKLSLKMFPDDVKPHHHLTYALNGLVGYDAARRHIRLSLDRFGNNPTILVPATEVAFTAEDWSMAVYLLSKIQPLRLMLHRCDVGLAIEHAQLPKRAKTG